MITFHVITLFSQPIESYCNESILKKARKAGIFDVKYYNPMDYTEVITEGALPQRIDAKPYGGGPGMVLRAEPIIQAISHAVGKKRNVGYIHFAPRAELFTTETAHRIAQESLQKTKAIKDIVIVCGRYEGVDSRIVDIFKGRVLSIGEYVLTGGELPAMVIIDSVVRQLPGVLGCAGSLEETRDASGKYYTRPEAIKHKGSVYTVPDVLLSGHHKDIEKWRKDNV